MTLQTIYLIRHGEVDGNILVLDREVTATEFNHMVDHVAHEALNARGIAQVQAAVARLAGRSLACLYCSPLLRARQTANILAEGLHLPVIIRDDLYELLPARLPGPPDRRLSLRRAYLRSGLRLLNPFTPDTETALQAFLRIRRAWETMTTENRADFGVIGHQGIFRLLFLWLKLSPRWTLLHSDTRNGGVSVVACCC